MTTDSGLDVEVMATVDAWFQLYCSNLSADFYGLMCQWDASLTPMGTIIQISHLRLLI